MRNPQTDPRSAMGSGKGQDQSKPSLEGYMDQQPRAGKLDRQVQEQGVARVRVVLRDPLSFPKYLPYLSLLVGNRLPRPKYKRGTGTKGTTTYWGRCC